MIPYDSQYARGVRRPGHTLSRTAWLDIEKMRKAAIALEEVLGGVLPDTSESVTISEQLDIVLSYAEVVIARHDRGGAPADQTELNDMEAALRLAAKNPEQFKSFDVAGLKKAAAALRKKS